MESKFVQKPWGWEYTSVNGNKYTVGELHAEFNVVVDEFEDMNELFDTEAIVMSHLVDYVYGDLSCDPDDIKDWLDWRINEYEKHERVVRFLPNLLSRRDANTVYKCYIGTEERKRGGDVIISKERMYDIAKQIRGGR